MTYSNSQASADLIFFLEGRVCMNEASSALVSAGVHVLLRLNVVDLLNEHFEHIAHVVVRVRTRLPKVQSILLCKLLCSFVRHLSFRGLFLAYVKFVANKHDNDVRLRVFLDFLHPLLHTEEGLLLRDVIHNQSPQGLTVMPIPPQS